MNADVALAMGDADRPTDALATIAFSFSWTKAPCASMESGSLLIGAVAQVEMEGGPV